MEELCICVCNIHISSNVKLSIVLTAVQYCMSESNIYFEFIAHPQVGGTPHVIYF